MLSRPAEGRAPGARWIALALGLLASVFGGGTARDRADALGVARASDWEEWPPEQVLAQLSLLAPGAVLDHPLEVGSLEAFRRSDNDAPGRALEQALRPLASGEQLLAAIKQLRELDRGQAHPIVLWAVAVLGIRSVADGTVPAPEALATTDQELVRALADPRLPPGLRFAVAVTRFAVAFEKGDVAAMRLRHSEALLEASATRPRIPVGVERLYREAALRRFAARGAHAAVLRECELLGHGRRLAEVPTNRFWRLVDGRLTAPSLEVAEWRVGALVALARHVEALEEIDRPGARASGWRGLARAETLLALGRPLEALQAARRARNVAPGHAAQELVGRCLLRTCAWDGAVAVFARALEEKGGATCPSCRGGLAVALLRGGRAAGDETRSDQRDLARRGPSGSEVGRLGPRTAGCALDRPRSLLAAAAATNEVAPLVLEGYALLAAAAGDHRGANELGARALARPEGDDELRTLEGRATRALARRQPREALAPAAELLERRPRSAVALRLLTRATTALDDPRAPLLLELLPGKTQEIWIHQRRGIERARRGDLAGARDDLERALVLADRLGFADELVHREVLARWLGAVHQALRPR